VDVLATDLAVTALAERLPVESDDAVVRLLEAWTAEIDARPSMIDVDAPEAAAARGRPRGSLRSVAAMTLALTLSSTGIAAAVKGDPFAPFNYMVHKFDLGDHDRSGPVDLFGLRKGLFNDPQARDSRERAEGRDRPSRNRPAETSRRPGLSTVASDPIVAHRVPRTAGDGGTPARQPERRRPLVVQRPSSGSVEKPGSNQTPPHHPELPSSPTEPSWPKPSSDQPAPAPDKPLS
jgi:hypothetical protein